MSGYLTRNMTLLAKIQAAIGTQESPTVGANAIKVRQGLQFSPNFDVIDTNYVRGGLDQSAPIIGGGGVEMTLGCYLKGSGSAGTAPEFAPLLRAAGFGQLLTAAAVTGTASAAAANSITLSGESSSDDAYNFMPITITSGTGAGQTRIITDYVGLSGLASVYPAWDTEPDNTSAYSVAANARYKPVSTGLELVTVWAYQHATASGVNSKLRKMFDATSNARVQLSPRGLASIDFNLRGILPELPSDVSHPGAATFQSSEAEPFMAADAWLGGARVKFSAFELDTGNAAEQFDDPAATYGYDSAQITARQMSGSITPDLVLNSSRNAFSDWLTSTSKPLWLNWGSASGKRVSIYIPELRFIGNTPGDTRGFAVEALPFRAPALDGGAVFTFW